MRGRSRVSHSVWVMTVNAIPGAASASNVGSMRVSPLRSRSCSRRNIQPPADDDPRPGQCSTDHPVVPGRADEQDRAARPPNEGRHQEPPLVIPGLQRLRRHGRRGSDGLVAGWPSSLVRRFRPLRLPAIHCRFATRSCRPFSLCCRRSGLGPQTRTPAARPRRPAFPGQPEFRGPYRGDRS